MVLWLPVVTWDEVGNPRTVRIPEQGCACGWPLRPFLTGLNEAWDGLGGMERVVLTVVPEEAWCALLCCRSSFTVIFTRTPWYTLGFSRGEATGSVVNSKAWVSKGCSEGSFGKARIPMAKFLHLQNTQRECKSNKTKPPPSLKLEKVNTGRCFRVLGGTVPVGIHEAVHP